MLTRDNIDRHAKISQLRSVVVVDLPNVLGISTITPSCLGKATRSIMAQYNLENDALARLSCLFGVTARRTALSAQHEACLLSFTCGFETLRVAGLLRCVALLRCSKECVGAASWVEV